MLELANIHTFYEESHILHGISLSVADSSLVALLGRNGMGKTTTVRSIIGFTPPRSGSVAFRGNEIQGLPPYKICQMGLALVPQGRRIWSKLSVKENLLIGARSGRWNLEKVYSVFPILQRRGDFRGSHLSGGEQQMLCIARALLTNPSFLLMDEPSEGLAPLVVREIGNIICELKKDGLSILLVEQVLTLALRISDYAYVINKGEIVYESRASELASNEEVKVRFLGVAN
jgi:branched-chain amino acid transport system ATP-binding protein